MLSDLIEAIKQRVEVNPQSGCWNWVSSLSYEGYGLFCRRVNKVKETRAHRVSYRVFIGPIPPKKIICHRCDNKRCVNPDHLYAGTHSDNSKDRYRSLITRSVCIRGHDISESNYIRSPIGSKLCLICRGLRSAVPSLDAEVIEAILK